MFHIEHTSLSMWDSSPRALSTMFRGTIRKSYRAFTLVELLVVIAIVGLLAGLTIPVVGRAQESGNRAKCTSNLKGLGQCLNSYVADSGMFPVIQESSGRGSGAIGKPWTTLLAEAGLAPTATAYSTNQGKNSFWYCPSAMKSQSPAAINATTYAYSAAAGGIPVARVTAASKMALIMDGSWGAGTGFGSVDSTLLPYCCHPPTKKNNDVSSAANICFVDGHVEMRKRAEIPTSSTNVFWTGQN